MPSPKRVFLGWNKPALQLAVDYLFQAYADDNTWNLSKQLWVVPTARARRRLVELLQRVSDQQVLVRAPSVITLGDLPERLYDPTLPIALELEQTLAWTHVLITADPTELTPLLPTLPPQQPLAPWTELAGMIRRLHETLAAEGFVFKDLLQYVSKDSECRRWKVLDALRIRYLDHIGLAGRSDPYHARQTAINEQRCCTDSQIILIGTADLSPTLCHMLDGLAASVTVLVAAPESEATSFDRYGSILADRWDNRVLPFQDQQLISAADATQQVEAAAAQVSEFGQSHTADSITVGVTDSSYVPLIETELEQGGYTVHREEGWLLSQTAPGRLLNLMASMAQQPTWQTLAALVRHADTYHWIDQQLTPPSSNSPHWLFQLDQTLANHFPSDLFETLPTEVSKTYPATEPLRQTILRWLSPLQGRPQRISQWCRTIGNLLSEIYPNAMEDDDGLPETVDPPTVTRTHRALVGIGSLLQRFENLSKTLDIVLSASAAMDMVLRRLNDVRIVMRAEPDRIEVLGWLDLALDDSDAMVIVGLNHPFVPESITADPFLPGSLRSQMKMADNQRRFARDAYAVHAIVHSRTTVRWIVGRFAADGSPIPPSRLLGASRPADTARRMLRLLDQPPSIVPIVHRWSGTATTPGLPIPTAAPTHSVKTLSVTAFRDYLECPYRFYLRHVLRLRPLDDAARELAANQFGDLVHGAVEAFGLSEDCHLDKPRQIHDRVVEDLHRFSLDRYGTQPSPTVRLQITQAEQRLRVFADRQAERRQQGWKIWAVEAAVDEKKGAGITVDGQKMGMRGRFDRIDHHEETGQWAILDYKTHGFPPMKKHIEKGTGCWLDLQLPLYRLLAPFLSDLGMDIAPEEVLLGYFNIAEKERDTGIHLAEFSEAQYADATALIHDCIRGIRAGHFEISPDPVPFDDYAMICQSGVMQDEENDFETALQGAFDE